MDWQRWHEGYTDPTSELSSRLRAVQELMRAWLDRAAPGPQRLISMCAGHGQDVVGGLRGHCRAADVSGRLVEQDAESVRIANAALTEAGLTAVRAVRGDAADIAFYAGATPADLVLVCGVFGNISEADIENTIRVLPALCADGGTILWTRHRQAPDVTPTIRRWFERAGFAELAFVSPGKGRYAVGAHQLTERGPAYQPPGPLFTFTR
ncbi:MAG: class I SAM-dependent methyltransferase [Frankiaceae bacterium]|nr:class I SAM-dependent methyltransferase [Frankiaceae bacterium]